MSLCVGATDRAANRREEAWCPPFALSVTSPTGVTSNSQINPRCCLSKVGRGARGWSAKRGLEQA